MDKTIQKHELSSEEREKLVEDNMNLVRHIVFEKLHIPYKNTDSALSDGSFGLFKAATTYDSSKGTKFSTYAGKCITNEILMAMRRDKKHQRVSSLDTLVYTNDRDGSGISLGDCIPANTTKEFETIEIREETEKAINILLNYFKGPIRIAFLYSLSGMNQKDIAETLHLSQSYISRILKKAQKKLKEYISYNISLDYKEVIEMSIPNEKFYQFSFSSDEVSKFNLLFANLMTQADPNKIPTFELVHRNNRILLFLESEPESFAFIAQIIQEIDNFNLSFKSNNEEGEEEDKIEEIPEAEDTEEVQETQEVNENNQNSEEEQEEETKGEQELDSNQQKKSCNFRKDTIAEKILTFIISQETFRVSDINEKFPDCKNPIIQYVLTRAKKDNLITLIKKGVYKVNK